MRTGRKALVGALMIAGYLAVGSTGFAGLVYDNGAPNQVSGNEMTQWIQAEDFTLAGSTTLTDVKFWSVEGSYKGSIEWQIYANAGGTPGSLLFSGNVAPTRTSTGTPVGFGTEYMNDFSVGSITLGAGTYWLALHNGQLTDTVRSEFYWETTNSHGQPTGHEDISPFGDGFSYDNGQEHAFQLQGTTGDPVPEPSTMLLLGSGLLGLAGYGRKRAKK